MKQTTNRYSNFVDGVVDKSLIFRRRFDVIIIIVFHNDSNTAVGNNRPTCLVRVGGVNKPLYSFNYGVDRLLCNMILQCHSCWFPYRRGAYSLHW